MRHVLVFILFTLLFQVSASAHEEHREHGAHQHGSAELSIAFDGISGKIEFKSPSDSIMGFEHTAKSAADKKSQEQALKKFETNIGEMLVFEKSLQCQFTKDKLEVQTESAKHSDTLANFSVKCAKSPAGTTLSFNFQKFFPALKDVDAQIIVDTVQKSAEIKANGFSVPLK